MIHSLGKWYPSPQIQSEQQTTIESFRRIALTIAKEKADYVASNFVVKGTIKTGQLRRIQHLAYEIGWPEFFPQFSRYSWQDRLDYIKGGGGYLLPVSAFCDIYLENQALNKRLAILFIDPNLIFSVGYQRQVAGLFKLYTMENNPITEAFLGLPYWGDDNRKSDEFLRDARLEQLAPVILIGDEFWRKISRFGG
jgi:hypothetical protein